MASKEELIRTIIQVIQETLTLKGVQAPLLTIDSSLDQGLGLDSLDWAAIVVRLEEETQVDPFRQGLRQELRTVGDLVESYLAAIAAGESVQ